jgi:hypothetical protein
VDAGGPGAGVEPDDAAQRALSHGPLQRQVVVDSAISLAKVGRDLDLWHANAADHWSREGAMILAEDGLVIDVAFATRLDGLQMGEMPVAGGCALIAFAVRLDYTNFDLEPPSLTFIHPMTKELASPVVPFRELYNGEERSVLLSEHPITGLPFICQPGNAEYHAHLEHRDESWLHEHRSRGVGRLANVVEGLWRASTAHATFAVSVTPFLALQPMMSPLRATQSASDADSEPVNSEGA